MIYLDASLLVSLYCPDTNSAAAGGALQFADAPLLLTPLGEVEAFNAMQLRVFRREISSQQAEDSAHHFEYDLQAGVYRQSSLPESAFERARQLSRQLTARLERNQSCYIPVLRGAVNLYWRFSRRLDDGTTLLG